jgi:hypothetical protein
VVLPATTLVLERAGDAFGDLDDAAELRDATIDHPLILQRRGQGDRERHHRRPTRTPSFALILNRSRMNMAASFESAGKTRRPAYVGAI